MEKTIQLSEGQSALLRLYKKKNNKKIVNCVLAIEKVSRTVIFQYFGHPRWYYLS